MILRLFGLMPVVAVILNMTACTTTDTSIRNYICDDKPDICWVGGALALAGASAFILSATHEKEIDATGGSIGGGGGHGGGGGPISDRRLKHDIKKLGILPNGLPFYSYKYLGDEKTFVGVMAQDLLNDDRYRNALIAMPSGYYAVNYSRLGLLPAHLDEMTAAGYKALEHAELKARRP